MKRSHYEDALHHVVVLRTEAAARLASPHAHQREFGALLETWAANADERAARLAPQPDLFMETDHA